MVKIRGRKMYIPQEEESVGFVGDNKTDVREFEITDKVLFDFNFKLDLKIKEHVDIVDLEKVVEQDKIILRWVIEKKHLPMSGMLFAQLRAFNEEGDVWHSEKNHFWIIGAINAEKYLPSPLPSEFSQMEQQVTSAKNEVVAAKEIVVEKTEESKLYSETILNNAAIVTEKLNQVDNIADTVTQNAAEISSHLQTVSEKTIETLQSTEEAINAATIAQTKAGEASNSAIEANLSAQKASQSEQGALQHLNSVEVLINDIKDSNVKKYGVRRVRGASSSTLERIWDTKGLVANVGVDEEIIQNDFDDIYPWSHIRTCNIEVVDNEIIVKAYEGEPSFTRDGSNGNVAVEIPKFYICPPDLDDIYEYWGVSEFPIGGWYLSPDFIGENGQVLDKVYYSAYNASVSNDKLISASGYFPEVTRSRASFRELAKETDKCCCLIGLPYHNILSNLFTVEFATLNSQSKMYGAGTLSYNSSADTSQATENNVNRIILANPIADKYVERQTIAIGTTPTGTDIANNRIVSSIEYYDENNKALYFDGNAVNIAANNFISSRAWKTGLTDSVVASSGSMLSNTTGKYPCKYRGIENPWGNIYQWIDGVNISDFQAWVCANLLEYKDDSVEKPYRKLSYISATAEGYVKDMGFDTRYPWARLPVETGGSSTTYYSDNHYTTAGIRALSYGGTFTHGVTGGLWFFSAYSPATATSPYIGSRLSWKLN